MGQIVAPRPDLVLNDAAQTDLIALDDLAGPQRWQLNRELRRPVCGRLGEAASLAVDLVHHLDTMHSYQHLGNYLPLADLQNFSRCVIDILRKHGQLDVIVDEFGEECIALVAAGCSHKAQVLLGPGSHILGLPAEANAKDATKLQLLIQLVREGWGYRPVVRDAITSGGDLLISLNMIVRAKKYLECLVDAAALFARGFTMLAHGMPEAYHECLRVVDCRLLQVVHGRADFATMRNQKFLVLLTGVLPDVDAPPALEDVVVADDERPDRLAIDDVHDEPIPLDDVAGAALAPLRLEDALSPMAHLAPVHFNGYVARFDRWSHSSRQLRCYVQCDAQSSGHRACFRYAQLNTFPSRRRCVAHHLAWAELGV